MSKIYYFVDYENVHEAGITGMNKLPKDSEVHLFYSQNANKLNLDLLRFVKAKVRVHKVKPGKQSLDMQMVSYLGYCIGDEDGEGTFILVSKDTDYANTVLFWREEGVEVKVQPAILEEKNAEGMERALRSVKVTRRGRRGGRKTAAAVQETVTEDVKAEAPAAEPVPSAPSVKEELPAEVPAEEAPAQAEEAVKEEKKTSRRGRRGGRGRKSQSEAAPAETVKEPEAETPAREGKTAAKAEKTEKPEVKAPAAKAEKAEAKTPAAKASKTEKPEKKAEKTEKPEKKAEKTEAKPPVQNKAVPDEPAKVTVTVHDVPMVTHAVAPQPKPEKTASSRVQAVLAEKKADAAVARKVASIVQKHEGAKNSRQAVYLEIRKTFGQKMGVDLYNQIKPLLR